MSNYSYISHNGKSFFAKRPSGFAIKRYVPMDGHDVFLSGMESTRHKAIQQVTAWPERTWRIMQAKFQCKCVPVVKIDGTLIEVLESDKDGEP